MVWHQCPGMMALGFLRCRGRPTDIYALGACLYTFVYGRIPFTAPTVYQLFQVSPSP